MREIKFRVWDKKTKKMRGEKDKSVKSIRIVCWDRGLQ